MTPPELTAGDAVFLDFDGVLTGIVADPDAAVISADQARLLSRTATSLGGALAVLSGRGIADLAARVPADVWRLGSHGIDIAPPGAPAPPAAATPPDLLAALARVVAGFPGCKLEPKGHVVAVHYRAAPAQGAPLGHALRAALADFPAYALHGGKMVWEAKPEGCDKGAALTALMRRPPFAGRRPVMVGDDVTDEDGFAAALALDGGAVKVGPGATAAPWRLADPAAVWAWLGAFSA